RASYVLYGGLRVPLADNSFDNIYSIACLQHIEKHHAFLVLKELVRLLKPGGHGTVHLLSIDHVPTTGASMEHESWKHVLDTNTHWMHYYSFDELVVLFSYGLGVSDLDVKFWGTSFWVPFSSDTTPKFHSPVVE